MADQRSLTEFPQHLPARINGWEKSPEITFYTPKNLYEYIDGGAELYISYSFKQLLAMTYRKEGFPEIVVDIFDMGCAADAFGVFVHGSENVDRSIDRDVESESAAGLLTFWKGQYYISILAYPESAEKKQTVLALGKHIAGLIVRSGEKPALLNRLPAENRVSGSTRYFHHYVWLNSLYYISDSNILLIDENTEVVMAGYTDQSYVLLAAYPDKKRAKAAYRNFLAIYLSGTPNPVKKRVDGHWTGCRLTGRMVAAVFNAPSARQVEKLLESCLK